MSLIFCFNLWCLSCTNVLHSSAAKNCVREGPVNDIVTDIFLTVENWYEASVKILSSLFRGGMPFSVSFWGRHWFYMPIYFDIATTRTCVSITWNATKEKSFSKKSRIQKRTLKHLHALKFSAPESVIFSFPNIDAQCRCKESLERLLSGEMETVCKSCHCFDFCPVA